MDPSPSDPQWTRIPIKNGVSASYIPNNLSVTSSHVALFKNGFVAGRVSLFKTSDLLQEIKNADQIQMANEIEWIGKEKDCTHIAHY